MKDPVQLAPVTGLGRSSELRIVLCNGCFDVLHPGHVRHLQEARAMGGELVVGLTRDEFVNKGPGRPIYKWEDRAFLLRALRGVHVVIACNDAIHAMRLCRPHIFCKGPDYAAKGLLAEEIAFCEAHGIAIRFTTSEKLSATETIKKAMSA